MTTGSNLSTRFVLSRTLDLVERSMNACAVYVVVMLTFGIAMYLIDPTESTWIYFSAMIVGAMVYSYAGYELTRHMLRRTGITINGGGFIFYFSLGVVMATGVVFGLFLLIVPGLVLLARWSLALPISVHRVTGIRQALGESWDKTSGGTVPIVLAHLIVIAIFYLPSGAIGYYASSSESLSVVLSQGLLDALAGAFLVALSAALFLALEPTAAASDVGSDEAVA